MDAAKFSKTVQRLLPGAVIMVLLAGCVSPADRELAAGAAMMREHQLRDSSPATTVWLENRTGEPIREFGMNCKSVERPDHARSYSTSWTRQSTIGTAPTEIWSEKYPEPLVLETLKARFDKGGWCEYKLNYRCQPGAGVVIVVEAGGRATVRLKK